MQHCGVRGVQNEDLQRIRRFSPLTGQWSSWIGPTLLALLVGIGYFFAAEFSLVLLTKPDSVAVFWPAAGIAAGALIALGPGARWPITLAVLAACGAASLAGDRSLSAAIIFAFCNAGEALLVAFFLAGLVVLGGLQQWWLQPVLMKMDANAVFFGAAALTAFTDNAALTYLGSLVQGLSDEFKVALVAGAVTGGGLTVIANAPNPAGAAILKEKFADNAIHPLGLLLGALPPTMVAVPAFKLL